MKFFFSKTFKIILIFFRFDFSFDFQKRRKKIWPPPPKYKKKKFEKIYQVNFSFSLKFIKISIKWFLRFLTQGKANDKNT